MVHDIHHDELISIHLIYPYVIGGNLHHEL